MEKFIASASELFVYPHNPDEILDAEEIEKQIDRYAVDQTPYDFVTNNCEELVCRVLLRNTTYVKQYSSVMKNLHRINYPDKDMTFIDPNIKTGYQVLQNNTITSNIATTNAI